MAFATSNVRAGSSGDRRVVTGTWTGSEGDAAGAYLIYGKVFAADFFTNKSSDSPSQQPLTSLSQNSTTGITTITVSNSEAVTDGNFRVEVSG